jgi:hypothetical protein
MKDKESVEKASCRVQLPSDARRFLALTFLSLKIPMNLEDVAKRLLPAVALPGGLAPRERLTLARVADVLLQGVPHEIGSERVASNVDDFLVAGRSRRAWRVRVLLQLIELSTIPSHGRPFSQLSLEARSTLVREKWIGGKGLFRIYAKVRNLVLLGAYGDRSAAAATGYVPVPERLRFQRLRPKSLHESP